MLDKNSALAGTLAAALLLGSLQASAADPPNRLMPFPEDAAQSQPAAAQPAKPQPAKSNFQPKFRSPGVTRAQHLEPADEAPKSEQPATQSPPERLATKPEAPAADQPAGATGPELPISEARAGLEAAFAKSKTAATEAEYTEVIDMCRRANTPELSKAYQDYSRQLLGWSYNRRGEARAKDGRDAEALADFEAAIQAGAAFRAINNRGASYAAQGRDKEALADFDRAITMNRRFPDAWFNRGELRSKQNDDAGAIRDYTAAIALGSPTSAMYASRGHAYYRMQRFGDALRDYGEAVKLDPSNVAALINRGDTYSDVGKYGEAAKDYRAAVKVAPNSGRAFQAAAWLMATCPDAHYRDETLAIDAAKRAIEIEGPTYRNLTTLAAAQAAGEMFKEARETQEQAISAAPKEDLVTAEKMMSLYQREIAFRDRPFTAFTTPEETAESKVQQASGTEPTGPAPPAGRRAWFSQGAESQPDPADARQSQRLPPPEQLPGTSGPPQRLPKARKAAPKGRI